MHRIARLDLRSISGLSFGCFLFALAVLVLQPRLVVAQETSGCLYPTQQAASLLTAVMGNMTGGAALNDAVITAQVTRYSGADQEAGTAVLKALRSGQGRIDLSLPSGQKSEILAAPMTSIQAGWIDAQGKANRAAWHNSWTDTSWFFPPLSFLAAVAKPDFVAMYLGHEKYAGTDVEHLRVCRANAPAKVNAGALRIISRLSATEVYLQSGSLLPVAITFTVHPEDNAAQDIPVEVRYSDYRTLNGLHLPLHVTQFINGMPSLEFGLTNIAVNTGLSPSDISSVFSAQ